MSTHFYSDDERSGSIDLRLWWNFLRHLKPYRRWAFAMCGFGFALAIVESLIPPLTGWMIDEAITNGATEDLLMMGIAFAVMMVFFALFVWIFILSAGRLATGVAYDLRKGCFERLQELPFSFFDVRPTGWLVSRVTSDCSKVSDRMPWVLLDLFWGSTMLVGICTAMMLIDTGLALWTMAIVPPLVIATWFFKRKMLASSRNMRRTNSAITASFSESIAGVRTTKSLNREARNLEEFGTMAGEMHAHSMRNALQAAVFLPIVAMLGSMGVGLALWQGGIRLEEGTGLSIGMLIAFMEYAILFSMPIQELAARLADLQSAQAAAERVQGLLEEVPEIRDGEEVTIRIEEQATRPRPGRASDGGDPEVDTLEYRGIGFHYKPEEPVLDDFNLRISKGETIALVGPTGGGKSTIANLAARFYEPITGKLLINGVDYRERSLEWWQSQFGIVQQVPHLFSGSIRENIRYGRLAASDEEVEDAARRAGAHDFIERLDGGYEHDVGEGGELLSTGQRQLVSLARALLADPQVFIMDEATSSIDTETETLIQGAIDEILGGRISFVIAHRLSTIRHADRILFIADGRIVESGTHESLLEAGGRYAELCAGQFTASDS
ncbi:MAG: ABC transporter ATP-binding protein/permease [Phycisphaerales bacterium]|nr:ABC transporter ATP-binding protein/permease [Phycisphaerales bacterium]